MAGPSTLVVANDDPDACEVVARVLELDGHEVVRISNPEGVPGVVLDAGADGIVLDLMIGGYGANLDALERLRARSETRGREVRCRVKGWKQGDRLRVVQKIPVEGRVLPVIWLDGDGWSVGTIDQTALPHRFTTLTLTTLDDAVHETIAYLRPRS